MTQPVDPPIVITGGSVSIEFDDLNFQRLGRTFKKDDKLIDRIEITGEGISPITQSFNNGKCVISIFYK